MTKLIKRITNRSNINNNIAMSDYLALEDLFNRLIQSSLDNEIVILEWTRDEALRLAGALNRLIRLDHRNNWRSRMPILNHLLKRVQDLPPLPSLAIQIIKLVNNPETNVKDLESLINQDPSMATAMLKQANSAYYGYPRQISTIHNAIILLGFQTTKSLAISACVAPVLKGNFSGYKIEQEALWKHSLIAAMSAERLCVHKNLPYRSTAFTAGLLHDIGKIIISLYLQEVGSIIQEKAYETKLPYVEFEEKVIGYDHASVGGFMAKAWNLPHDLTSSIAYHHAPLKANEHAKLASILHVANGLASILGVGGGTDSFLNPIQQEPLDLLDLNKSDIEYLITSLGECLRDPNLFG